MQPISDAAAETGFNQLLGVRLKGLEGNHYVIELDVTEQHLHRAGRVHGGIYLSLLDIVMARASRASLDENSFMPTLQINANFLASASGGCITGRGRVISRTKRTCYVEGELSDQNGRLLARGSATMIAVDIPSN